MPVIDLTQTDEYRQMAANTWVAKWLPELEDLGYSIETDGWSLIEYMAYHLEND